MLCRLRDHPSSDAASLRKTHSSRTPPVLAYYPALRFRLSSCIDVRVAQLDNDVVPSIPQHALADDSVDNGRSRRLCLKGGNKLDQSGDALLSLAGVASYSCKGEIPIALRAGHAARSCNMQSECWQVSSRAAPLTRCRTKTAARRCTCEGSSCCEQLVHVADHAGRGLMPVVVCA